MMTFTPKEKSDKSFLLILNDNLLRIICSFLDSKNLIILGETCKGFNKLISENNFWQKIYFNKFNIFFLFDNQNTLQIIKNPKEYFTIEKTSNLEKNFFKNQFLSFLKLNKSWKESRPIETTISTPSSITCLHLNSEVNELIYSDSDGSAGLFRLYSYKNQQVDEIYMQHHKQTKICDKLCSYYGHEGPIWGLDRTQNILFTGSYDRTIKLWGVRTGQCIHTLRGHSSWVSSIKYEPKFEKLISGSWDATIKIWNMKNYQSELEIINGKNNCICCLVSNLSSGVIYAGTEEKVIKEFNIDKGGVVTKRFKGHKQRINSLKLSNHYIFSGSGDKEGRVWDIRTGKTEITLQGHTKGITCIDFDEISNRIYSSSLDTTIKIWDIRKNDKEIRTLVGHSFGVNSIAFDQEKLISGSKDSSIKIWNFSVC